MDGYSLNLVMMSEYETKIWLLENLDLYFTNLESMGIAIAIFNQPGRFQGGMKIKPRYAFIAAKKKKKRIKTDLT